MAILLGICLHVAVQLPRGLTAAPPNLPLSTTECFLEYEVASDMADVACRFDSNIAAAALKASRKAKFGDIFTDSQGGSEYLVAQFMTPQGMCRSCVGMMRLLCTFTWLALTSDIQMTRAWTYGPCTPLHVPFDKDGARNMYV